MQILRNKRIRFGGFFIVFSVIVFLIYKTYEAMKHSETIAKVFSEIHAARSKNSFLSSADRIPRCWTLQNRSDPSDRENRNIQYSIIIPDCIKLFEFPRLPSDFNWFNSQNYLYAHENNFCSYNTAWGWGHNAILRNLIGSIWPSNVACLSSTRNPSY